MVVLLKMRIQKLIIRKPERRKVDSFFVGSIWGADLADMQLMSKCNRGFRFLMCCW